MVLFSQGLSHLGNPLSSFYAFAIGTEVMVYIFAECYLVEL